MRDTKIQWMVTQVLAITAILAACGKMPTKAEEAATTSTTSTTTDTTVDEQVPSDSSGKNGTLALTMGRSVSGAALDDDDLSLDAATSIDLGSGIVLTTAKMSFGSIRVKSKGEQSDAEKEVEKAEEKEAEALKKADELKMEEMKTLKELDKEIAKQTDPEEKAKKQEEAKKKKAELTKKQAEESKKSDDEYSKKDKSRDKNTRWQGPYVYNFLDQSLTPALDSVAVADGSYRRIEFKLKPYRGTDATDPLVNNSVYLAGTASVNGSSRSFTFALHTCEAFRMAGSNGMKVDADASNKLALNFDASTWFSSVDFSTATLNSDGSITLDKDNNKSIWKVIRRNIKKSVMFGKPSRDDGRLSSTDATGDSKDFSKTEEEKEKSESSDK